MQISSRFTMAIHIFACIDVFQGEHSVTSDFLAGSIGANPVTIRRILPQLGAAGLIHVSRGRGGMSLARPLEQITFFDVYNAVEDLDEGELFRFHEQPNPQCPVGRNIHRALDDKLAQVQRAMEEELGKISVADVVRDARRLIAAETDSSGGLS